MPSSWLSEVELTPIPIPPYGGRDSLPSTVCGVAGEADVVAEPVVAVVAPDVGPVDQEGALVPAERGAGGALVGHREVGGRRLRVGQLLDHPGGLLPGVRRDVDLGVGSLVGLGGDVTSRAGDQGVDPHGVALVLVGLDPDLAAVVAGGVDDLVPGDRLLHVDAGLVHEGLAVPETCVLDQNGATTSWSSQVAASVALSKACALEVSCMSCGISAR